MCAKLGLPGCLATTLMLLILVPAHAEITNIRGAASATLTEFRGGEAATTATDSGNVPDTGAGLPLQVMARLLDPDRKAAAVSAAQFADPILQRAANPRELAISLVLDTISPSIRYDGSAFVEEVRSIVIAPGEIGSARSGQRVTLRGRLLLDGALAVFCGDSATDLTNARVTLRVIITREQGGSSPEELLRGVLEIEGGANRTVTAFTEGDFPQLGILRTDLAGIDPELGVFDAFVFPSLGIDYTYAAIVGTPLELRARVEVEATHPEGAVGVAAILGTPLSELANLLQMTQGEETGAKMIAALERERAAPTGGAAFPEAELAAQRLPFLPACGLAGIELALAGVVLSGWCVTRACRDRVAR